MIDSLGFNDCPQHLATQAAVARLAKERNGGYASFGMRAMTLISKSKPASQFTPIAVQFG